MHKILFSISLMMAASFSNLKAFAASFDDDYYTITNVVTEDKDFKESVDFGEDLHQSHLRFSNLEIKSTETPVDGGGLEIVDMLLKVWDIIQQNKPVVNMENHFASALPEVAKEHWEKLVGWKPERSFTRHVYYENGFGMKVVDLEYQVKLLYGGNVKGQGLYIAMARVVPLNVNVMWGFTLDVKVDVPVVMNIRTEENPLAAIQLDVNWTVKTTLKSQTTAETYQLQGNGLIQDTKRGTTIFGPALPQL